jgi:hypothetical protein
MAQPPAAIRHNNPGGMYPGPSATRYGSTGYSVIGGGHKIAQFDDPVKGAAAQFDLLDRGYAGMTIGQAVQKWSGGNNSAAYAQHLSKATGVPLDAPLTKEMLRDPNFAIPFAKASAQWETGQPFPMNDDQWKQAHSMAFSEQAPQQAVAGIGGNTAATPFGMGGVGASAPSTSGDADLMAQADAAAREHFSGSGGFGGDAEKQAKEDEAKAMSLASGAMSTAAAGAKGDSKLIGMNYGPKNVDISRLMAVLKNRQRLGA